MPQTIAEPSPLFAVHYLDHAALGACLARQSVIAVVGYGANRPAVLPRHCPYAAVSCPVVTDREMFEVWTTADPARPRQRDRVIGAASSDLAFGMVELDESRGEPLEHLVKEAYLGIFEWLAWTGFDAPIRFWNYLPRLTAEQDGIERYRRFNIGRHEVFSQRPSLAVPPVASCIGGPDGPPLIHFLAARESGRAIENPRQVSAYSYPTIYGPRSPKFSRAALVGAGPEQSLLISGTASIVGHESRHHGDVAAQITETFNNLRALSQAAECAGFPAQLGRWSLKVYLRTPGDLDMIRSRVEDSFGPDCTAIYLRADLCRAELLVEIEAVCSQIVAEKSPPQQD